MTDAVKHFLLEQSSYPINQPVNHTRHRAVGNDGPCDLENLCAEAEDEALCFKFHGGAGDGIGKAGDGNDGAAAGMLC